MKDAPWCRTWKQWVWRLLVGTGTCGVVVFPRVCDLALKRATTVGRHAGSLEKPAMHLERHVALRMARQALEKQGCDLHHGIPVEDGRTKAPDGRPDVYVVKNADTPNRGAIWFRNESEQRSLCVNVSLEGRTIACLISGSL